MIKINNKYNVLFLLICCFFSSNTLSSTDCKALKLNDQEAIVIKVMDGDSARVKLHSGKVIDVRFFGVDTPESEWRGRWKAQPFSRKAKNLTKKLVNGKDVMIRFNGQSTYKRCVGEVFTNGTSVSLTLVSQGLAWWYEKYAPYRHDLKKAQASAKLSRLGIWSERSPTPPWLYRSKHNK